MSIQKAPLNSLASVCLQAASFHTCSRVSPFEFDESLFAVLFILTQTDSVVRRKKRKLENTVRALPAKACDLSAQKNEHTRFVVMWKISCQWTLPEQPLVVHSWLLRHSKSFTSTHCYWSHPFSCSAGNAVPHCFTVWNRQQWCAAHSSGGALHRKLWVKCGYVTQWK